MSDGDQAADPTFNAQAYVAAIRAASADLFRLRGELLAEAASIENHLHNSIMWYFDLTQEKESDFVPWVMARLSMTEKIDIFRRIVNSKECEWMANLVGRLQAANTFRNSIAHSAVSAFPVGGELRTTASWLKSSGRVSVETNLDKLENWLSETAEIGRLVFVVSAQILCGRQPFDSRQTDWAAHYADVCRDGVVAVPNKYLDRIPDWVEPTS